MAKVRVYRFDYFDTLLKRDRRSVDYATADAIAEQGGTILAESMREVDEELIPESGVIRAAQIPWPGSDEPHEIRRPRTPPGETRMGPG
ncbi:MAG TPA: hypothetical protein VNU21_09135 [Usitatibacter sp.]|jgi:hypothetical protein|nr:hypothetical protein [Usitatibacter sp.]